MTTFINEYTPELVLPNYKTTNYGNELELQLLMRKETEYDQVMQRIQNLQAQGLNITMLNVKGQEKLKRYNEDINSLLSQDLGDLTDVQVQNKIASYFTSIANDTDLKRRAGLSKKYQKEMSMIDQMKASKDPTKSGYNEINELVFRKWDGGLEDFMMADNVDNWESKFTGYVPYKNISQKLVNLTKLLHSESTTRVSTDNSGRLFIQSEKGVNPERIRKLLTENLDQDELSQFGVMAKYRILTESPTSLYESYKSWVGGELRRVDSTLKEYEAFMNTYDQNKIPASITGEERERKKAEYQTLQNMYRENIEALKESRNRIAQADLTPEEWASKNRGEMLPFVSQLEYETRVNKISEALSWKDEVEAVKADEAYWKGAHLNYMRDALKWKQYVDQTEIEIKKLKASGKSSDPDLSLPAAQTVNRQRVAETWDALKTEQLSTTARTTNIILDPSFDVSKLSQPNWRNEHNSNHYVALWDEYAAINNNTGLSKEGFKAFLSQVDKGDYKGNANVQGILERRNRDVQVADYLADKIQKVNKIVTQSGGDPLDVRVDTGGPALREYMSSNGTFGVKDGKGGYKPFTWQELKEEYERAVNEPPSNVSMGRDEFGVQRTFTKPKGGAGGSILKNDPYFFKLVGAAVAREKANEDGIMSQILSETMPGVSQGKMVTVLSDKFNEYRVLPFINESYSDRLAGGSFQFAADDIQTVQLPYGIGKFGTFTLTEKGAERISQLGELKLIGPEGEQIDASNLKANQEYRFRYEALDKYDVLYNQMLKDKGTVKVENGGFQFYYNYVPTQPNNIKVNIVAPDGQKYSQDVPYNGNFAPVKNLVEQTFAPYFK